jgi:hypothetical protein
MYWEVEKKRQHYISINQARPGLKLGKQPVHMLKYIYLCPISLCEPLIDSVFSDSSSAHTNDL